MAENKTKATAASVAEYLESVEPAQRRENARAVDALMQRVTGERPKMWGASIVGYGTARYAYASGREGDWFLAGFAPRKANLVLYLNAGLADAGGTLARLGRHKTGVGCLYLRRLDEVDLGVLEELIRHSVASMRALSSRTV